MTIARARVIKAHELVGTNVDGGPPRAGELPTPRRAVVLPAAIVEAREEAARLVHAAEERARAILREAEAKAAREAEETARAAREAEIARLAAAHVALRAREESRAAREIDRTVAMAVMLAERIVGEALAVDGARIATLATEALRETRGARRMRIEASPADLAMLRHVLAEVGSEVAEVVEVVANDELTRGSVVVETELGRVDARLRPQLERLAIALRDVLAEELRG